MKSNIPTIVIDTREQTPWEFDHPKIYRALPAGDYSVDGMESLVAIERKRHAELVSCMTAGRDRFERELERSNGMHRLHLVAECSVKALLFGLYDDWPSDTHVNAIRGTIISWDRRFPNLRLHFCGDRESAQEWAWYLLQKSWKDYQSGKIGGKNVERN